MQSRAGNHIKLSDGGGLYLLVQPRGAKLWRLAYRYQRQTEDYWPSASIRRSHSRTLALGATPPKSILEDGVDPSVQRKIDKQARGITFRLVAEELLDKMRREGRAPATLAKTQWLLEFAYDVIGDRPIAKITAPEMLAILRKIEARGTYETARRSVPSNDKTWPRISLASRQTSATDVPVSACCRAKAIFDR